MAGLQTAPQFDGALATLTEATMAARAACVTKVGKEIAARHSLESLNTMQDIMVASLKGDRAEFLEVFGGDCCRVAMKRASVEQLQVVLADSSHAADRRLQRSVEICRSVEDVLTSVDLGQSLATAQLQAQKRIETAAAATQEAHAAPEDQPTVARMNTEWRAMTLKELDDAVSHDEARAIVEDLFKVFDQDGNGILEGREAEMAIDDLVAHLMREGARRSSKWGGRKLLPSVEAVRTWVWKVVDKDGDGKITPAEAIQGFVAVVDEVDEPEEREASMAKRASLPNGPMARDDMEAGRPRRFTH